MLGVTASEDPRFGPFDIRPCPYGLYRRMMSLFVRRLNRHGEVEFGLFAAASAHVSERPVQTCQAGDLRLPWLRAHLREEDEHGGLLRVTGVVEVSF